jgi:hypothetical protein
MPNYPYPPPPPQAGWDGYEDASGNGGGWYVPPEGYPAGSSSYPGHGQTTRRDTVGSSSRLSFSTQADAAESKTPGSGTGTGGKKKRKKGSPGETEKEKEKRTKTGRACDACVRLSVVICDERWNGLMDREQRRLDVISYRPRKLWDEKRCVHTVNSILWNVLSSYL